MRRVLGCTLLMALGACVGPNFHKPAPPPTASFTDTALPSETASASGGQGDAQRFLGDLDVPRDWWKLFGSAALDGQVREALEANPQVASAQAALRQARENVAAQSAAFLPTIQGGFSAERDRDATGVLQPTLQSGQPIYNLFTPQLSIGFVPDLFGGNRRQVESLAAQAEAQRDQLDATYLTLTTNVVTAVVQEAMLDAEIDATHQLIALAHESLDVLRHQAQLGAIAEADVYAQETVVAQLEVSLPSLEQQRHVMHDQLAALTGHLPAEYHFAGLKLEELTLPTDLALGLPSQLVARRPDVRAAEAQLHAATANVGVAIANMLPQFNITADMGSSSTAMNTLFKSGTGFWSVGGSATQTLFAGGALLHKKRAADAALDQAGADYKVAVLTAFQNVADALHAIDSDARALQAAVRAESAASKSLEVMRQQLKLGSVGYLSLLAAEQGYRQAVLGTVQSRGARLADTAALFQALGGSVSP